MYGLQKRQKVVNDDILRLKAFNGLHRQNLYVFTLWQDALFYGTYSDLAIT